MHLNYTHTILRAVIQMRWLPLGFKLSATVLEHRE